EPQLAVLLEVKNTDWDELQKRGSVQRNARRHARQVLRYLSGGVPEARSSGALVRFDDIEERYAAVVYPRRPRLPGVSDHVEATLEEEGISTVWFDQPPPRNSPAWNAWTALLDGTLPSLRELREIDRDRELSAATGSRGAPARARWPRRAP